MYIYFCKECKIYKHSLKQETCEKCGENMTCKARYNVAKREKLRKEFKAQGKATFNTINHEINAPLPDTEDDGNKVPFKGRIN